jgi:hypothetical protein
MARAIDADRLKQAIDHDYYEHYTKYHDSDQTALIDMVMDDIDEMPTLTPPNEPLTLEQLREMEGQPVWVKCLKPNKYINPPVRWRILEKSIMGTFGVWDGESCLSERDYGTDWLAYRRPPEGES